MCFVRPIHPTRCHHHYYLLLAACTPTSSLSDCTALVITAPHAGSDGKPHRVEGGLCPRCDLDNEEGVDLGKVRFYKPKTKNAEAVKGKVYLNFDSSGNQMEKKRSRISLGGTGRGGDIKDLSNTRARAKSASFWESREVIQVHVHLGTDSEDRTASSEDEDYDSRHHWWRRRGRSRQGKGCCQQSVQSVHAEEEEADAAGEDRGRRRDRFKNAFKGMVEGVRGAKEEQMEDIIATGAVSGEETDGGRKRRFRRTVLKRTYKGDGDKEVVVQEVVQLQEMTD
ncbi:hypothetical protein BDZ91DRAFT_796755 [Kalaharituber pfeilii]|nr:hypothetical protein BDZ91DRAFT_796755 [Kalaharituber pfeilii]